MAKWSNPVRLKDYCCAPNEAGVYEIGFFRNSNFNPYYIGRAQGNASVRSRLSSHYAGNGNGYVLDHYLKRERDHLYCRWFRTDDPVSAEANILNRHGCGHLTKYPWNKRLEN